MNGGKKQDGDRSCGGVIDGGKGGTNEDAYREKWKNGQKKKTKLIGDNEENL